MPLRPVKLEMGEFTEEDTAKIWETFREVWKREKQDEEVA